jgi:hypothetical protein
MPKYRDVYIEKEKTLADSGTVVVDLSVVDPISEIIIAISNKNGSTSNKNNPISRNISKIELTDGSNVIYSMSGMLAQSLSYYQRGIMPAMQRQGGPDENQEDQYVIRFGRKLWDELFALVPAKFRNLQLKITYDFATVTAIGVTGFTAGEGSLTVICRLLEELQTVPVGYMMAKNHYNWTTAASGDERVVLPSDHNYVLMMLRAWEVNTKLFTTIKNIKLSVDQDRDIPFDLSAWESLRMMAANMGLFTIEQHVFAASEENIQTWIGSDESVVVTPEGDNAVGATAGAIATIYGVDSGHFNLKLFGNDGQVKAAGIIHVVARGQALNHCFAFPFGVADDPATWLDVSKVGDIKAVITQGNAGASADLVLVQAKLYA